MGTLRLAGLLPDSLAPKLQFGIAAFPDLRLLQPAHGYYACATGVVLFTASDDDGRSLDLNHLSSLTLTEVLSLSAVARSSFT